MMKFLKNTLITFALSALVMSTSGCFALLVGAAAGAASAVYVKGDLEKNFDDNLKTVHKAALAGMKSENIFVTQDSLSHHEASILGEFDNGEKVKVSIKSLTEKSSKVKIRVGVIGDEIRSGIVMSAIERKL